MPHGGASRRRFLDRMGIDVMSGAEARNLATSATFRAARQTINTGFERELTGSTLRSGQWFNDITHAAFSHATGLPFVTGDTAFMNVYARRVPGFGAGRVWSIADVLNRLRSGRHMP